jgi:hypothetical protein
MSKEGKRKEERKEERQRYRRCGWSLFLMVGTCSWRPDESVTNDPNGFRPEPGTHMIASTLLFPPGEVPEGRAHGVQDTAVRVQSESER